jgi:hypothetical protein
MIQHYSFNNQIKNYRKKIKLVSKKVYHFFTYIAIDL